MKDRISVISSFSSSKFLHVLGACLAYSSIVNAPIVVSIFICLFVVVSFMFGREGEIERDDL